MSRACVFAHFDKDGKVDAYVYYYLNELVGIVNKLIFVTVSTISEEDNEKLKALGIEVIQRENIGYDFYSYKTGIERLNLNQYDELIICNDSVLGPLYPFKSIFDQMKKKQCDFWGITDSNQIAYHIQSYFLVFNKSIISSMIFNQFWNDVTILNDKFEIIRKYEVGLSQLLIANGYQAEIFSHFMANNYNSRKRLLLRLLKKPYKIFKFLVSPSRYIKDIFKKNVNSSIKFWDFLLIQNKFPFIKKSLLTDSDEGIDNFNRLKSIFEKKVIDTRYPFYIIENFFERIHYENEK